jgi:hypothetical protein
MRIQLTKSDLRKILVDRFGDEDFSLFYTESDKRWEARNDKKISELLQPPDKESYVLEIDED